MGHLAGTRPLSDAERACVFHYGRLLVKKHAQFNFLFHVMHKNQNLAALLANIGPVGGLAGECSRAAT